MQLSAQLGIILFGFFVNHPFAVIVSDKGTICGSFGPITAQHWAALSSYLKGKKWAKSSDSDVLSNVINFGASSDVPSAFTLGAKQVNSVAKYMKDNCIVFCFT